MADTRGTPPRPGGIPAIDPAALGAQHDADLAGIVAQLAGPNPHGTDMGLPAALLADGGLGS